MPANLSLRIRWGMLVSRVSGVVREHGGEGLMHNAMALMSVQFVRKSLPLITIPYLARVLGPGGWGLVATFQSLALTMVLLIEFGFPLSATRRVACCRESMEKLSEIWAGVVGVQCLLAIGAIVITGLISLRVPLLRNHIWLTIWALVWAIAEGMNPVWYFLGVERMKVIAGLEICSKIAMAAGIVATVHSANDIHRVMAIQGIAPVLSLAVAMWLIRRDISFRAPTLALMREAMRSSWPLFIMRSAESIYTLANAFTLGVLAGPGVVGYFAGPEKISRALFGFFNPVRDALYPRLSKLMHESPAQAARLARFGIITTGLGGLAMGLFAFLFAPFLVKVVLGEEFGPAVVVLRILAILPPLISVTQSVGMGWLLPLGRDRAITRAMALGGGLNLVLALLFVPRFAHIGIAWAVVCAEALVCLLVLYAAIADPERRLPIFRPRSSGKNVRPGEPAADEPVNSKPKSTLIGSLK